MTEKQTLQGSGLPILPATWRDLKDLHLLEKVCFQQDAWPLLDVLGVLTIPHIIRFKVEDKDVLVGFIAVDLRRSQQTAWIATLAVRPEYRRRGIATILIHASEKQVDLPRIKLSVRRSNQPAILLYQKHGYQQVEIWKKYYQGGDDALVFEKVIA